MEKGKRYFELDAIRGVAICGIIITNIIYFAYPTQRFPELFAPGTFWYTNTLNFVKDEIIGGRTATIFAFLFGLGMGMQWDKWQNLGFLFRRMGVLALIGVLHIVLLFQGDILFDYALFGFLGAFLLRFVKRPPALLYLAILIAIYPLLLMVLQHLEWVPIKTFTGGIKLSLEEKVHLYREGNYMDQCWHRIRYYLSIRQMPYVRNYYFPPVFACYIFGLYMAKTNVLKSFENKLLYGLIFSLTLTFKIMVIDFDYLNETLFFKVLMYIDQYSTSLLIVALVVMLCGSKTGKRIMKPFGVFGKTSLSSYVLQSVLASLFFYSWGLAYYNLLTPLTVELCALAFLVLIYFFNLFWLRLYVHGPLERVWRFLSNRKKLIS